MGSGEGGGSNIRRVFSLGGQRKAPASIGRYNYEALKTVPLYDVISYMVSIREIILGRGWLRGRSLTGPWVQDGKRFHAMSNIQYRICCIPPFSALPALAITSCFQLRVCVTGGSIPVSPINKTQRTSLQGARELPNLHKHSAKSSRR